MLLYEPRCEKTSLRGFRPGPTQSRLYYHTRWLQAGNFVFRKKRYCTIHVAKTKALISFAFTAKLICVFVFAYAKSRFSQTRLIFHQPFNILSVTRCLWSLSLLQVIKVRNACHAPIICNHVPLGAGEWQGGRDIDFSLSKAWVYAKHCGDTLMIKTA